MNAGRKACGAAGITGSVPSRRQLSRGRDSRIHDISDRLVEDARIFLLIVERHQTSYNGALDGLVRDSLGSADRLRAAAAAARAGGRPTAEVDLLERAADRAEQEPPLPAPRPQASPGTARHRHRPGAAPRSPR